MSMLSSPAGAASPAPRTSAAVREQLAHAVRLDLIGPEPDRYTAAPDDRPHAAERLPVSPSRWYLTGFLVPFGADAAQRADTEADDELALGGLAEGDSAADENGDVDVASTRRAFFPSSLGVSVLVPAECDALDVAVTWGDYAPERVASEAAEGEAGEGAGGEGGAVWQRTHHRVVVPLHVPPAHGKPVKHVVAGSRGPRGGHLTLVATARAVRLPGETGVPAGTRAVALFLVNERAPTEEVADKDRAFAFQAGLTVSCAAGFVARPDPRGGRDAEWDEQVADLQYRDVMEYAVGHGVSVEAVAGDGGACRRVATTWTPRGIVEVVEPTPLPGVMLGMEALADATPEAIEAGLRPMVERYDAWIADRRAALPTTPVRREVAEQLLRNAGRARDRIAEGIALLGGAAEVRRAFQVANRAMAMAARQRAVQGGAAASPEAAEAPRWRPFQLAFQLLTLPGLADPTHRDRETVDLLFFPTGGGKTEAYLGLAATAMVLRRLRNPGVTSAGLSVLMRYTLRLLTLDQLGRAATLVCALEKLRRDGAAGGDATLGPWPFEIGLWVGRAATPNRMGSKGDGDEHTARTRVLRYKTGRDSRTPIPLESCPWCGARFTQNSFQLVPSEDRPLDLRVVCANRGCDFRGDRPLPIVTVDEPIYRRLPAFVIATVDKFAALPWEGRVGAFFGHVQRYDADGFYGPCDPGRGALLPGDRLPPPDLVIQDELHLISGPLGTIAGLYEAAIDALAARNVGGEEVRPKVLASTATVRRADAQVRALFGRRRVELFPPPSPERRDAFFARTAPVDERHPRLYLGVAAPGRSLKVLMLRSTLALLGAAQRAYEEAGGAGNPANPADPYMTLVGYFNALRELGGSRRIVEDEVTARLARYGDRRRLGERRGDGLFADRLIKHEVTELTSRVGTSQVSDAKRRLALRFGAASGREEVDVALATNMISVGLDITRLGLMLVLGQPKASAEYIQATSRVGRDAGRPGLVVTLLNVHRPRDRSHYERFAGYHSTFYRSVEATSVTPFAPRAVDRALAAVTVGLARQGHRALTAPATAGDIPDHRAQLDFVVEWLGRRAAGHAKELSQEDADALRGRVQERVKNLLDSWTHIARDLRSVSGRLRYQKYEGADGRALLVDPLDPALPSLSRDHQKFKANRSMRDVEPEVALWIHGERGSREA